MVAPDLAANDGILRAVDIICPQATVLNPNPPAAASVRHNTCQRLADTLIRVMTDLWPELGVASSTVSFFGLNIGSRFSEVLGRFSGAWPETSWVAALAGTPEGDGIDGVDTYMLNVGLMPAEVVETNYQVRLLQCELRPGSQGQGTHSGGLGLDPGVRDSRASATGYLLRRADEPGLRPAWPAQRAGCGVQSHQPQIC